MIVCADRPLAFKVLKEILAIRPEWCEAKKAEDESQLSKEELDKLMALPKVNMVATQRRNDEKELFEMCGIKEYRKKLDKQFKNNNTNSPQQTTNPTESSEDSKTKENEEIK